jgi:hypothetical protein
MFTAHPAMLQELSGFETETRFGSHKRRIVENQIRAVLSSCLLFYGLLGTQTATSFY